MLKHVKAAIIGTGSYASRIHIPSLCSFKDITITGMCDLNENNLKKVSGRLKIKDTFTDYRKMLDRIKADIVYVILPPHHVFDIAMEVMDRGHHLFIEKPPCITTFQTKNMARMAAMKRIISAVGFQRRYHPMLYHCFEQVRKNAGNVLQVISSYYKNCSFNEQYPYYNGAVDLLRCDAIHAVDAIRYYCGLSEIKSLASSIKSVGGPYENIFQSIINFENNATGILNVNWRSGRRFLKFEFHGDGCMAFVDTDGEGKIWKDNCENAIFESDVKSFSKSDEEFIISGACAENRAFIDAVKKGQQVHNNLEDAVKTMRLIDMIYQNTMDS